MEAATVVENTGSLRQAQKKAYYETHKAEWREWRKAWNAANRDKVLAAKKAYRERKRQAAATATAATATAATGSEQASD